MKNIISLISISMALLTGCSHQPVQKVSAPVDISSMPIPVNNEVVLENQQMQECENQLAAMKLYDGNLFDKYNKEKKQLSEILKSYQFTQADIGNEINDIISPKTKFQQRELCFRIKTELANLMIRKTSFPIEKYVKKKATSSVRVKAAH